jgi:hypothetical protein
MKPVWKVREEFAIAGPASARAAPPLPIRKSWAKRWRAGARQQPGKGIIVVFLVMDVVGDQGWV